MVSAEFCGLVWHGTSIGFSGNKMSPPEAEVGAEASE